MRNYTILVLMTLLGWSNAAMAENGCPSGYVPMPQQFADPASGTVQMRTTCVPGGAAQEVDPGSGPRAVWEDRWGAVAADGSKGILGAANGEHSEAKAKKKALNECKAKGGNCKLQLAYHNQCAILVSGDKVFFVQAAESAEIATQVGIEKCSKMDVNCKVHYSGCSHQEQVR